MSDADRPPSRETTAPPGAADRAHRDARIRSLERVYMRRGMVFVVVSAVLFMVGLWGFQKFVVSTRVATGPPEPKEVSHALRGVYNAAYADGIRMYESDRRADLARWLKEEIGSHAVLPDLAAAHLHPSAVRALNIGEGWGMIQYRDPAGRSGDVLVVMAPPDAVRVAPDAVAHPTDGRNVWVLAGEKMSFAWLEGAGADWVLVSARDEAGLLAVARAMLKKVG